MGQQLCVSLQIQCPVQPSTHSGLYCQQITTNSSIVVAICDDGVDFVLALSSNEVFAQSFPAFTRIRTYIIYKGRLFDLILICMLISSKAYRKS